MAVTPGERLVIGGRVVKPVRPSKYYRLRSCSKLTCKELLYGEVYFSSLKELTDPYDTKIYYRFKPNVDRYVRLLCSLLQQNLLKDVAIDYMPMASYLSESDLSYEDLIKKVSSGRFEQLLIDELLKASFPETIAFCKTIVANLKHQIHKHVGKNVYVASFTSAISDPVIWSLHADDHKGFALQITPIGDSLFQNPKRRKARSYLADGTPQYAEGAVHPFKQVDYVKQILPLNAFYSFKRSIFGRTVSQKNIDNYWKQYALLATRKYRNWWFEAEYRLVDTTDWMPDHVSSEGAAVRYSVDRLFYYDQTQLSGIVFGMNISDSNKAELVRIVEVMRTGLFNECNGCLPLFYFYNAKQSHSKYEMQTEPFLGLDMNNREFDPIDATAKEQEFRESVELLRKYNSSRPMEHAIFRSI
jgi:hypothetical protein